MSRPEAPRWLAFLACLFASVVPAAGLVLCVHGGTVEVGVGDDCPCELPHDHPDCGHLDVAGGGNLVTPLPQVQPPMVAGIADDVAVPAPHVAPAVPAAGGRAPPVVARVDEPRRRVAAELPWIARHLDARRTTSLQV